MHVDLYFFYDVDVVLLNVEVGADDLTPARRRRSCSTASAAPIPAGWDAQGPGAALHAPASNGSTPTAACWPQSDAQQRDAFLAHVAEHRAPRIAAHWAFAAAPAGRSTTRDEPGALRYRQIEYYRMPVMAYLAVDDPRLLTRSDFIRLGLVTGAQRPAIAGQRGPCPTPTTHLADFEQRYCYDRFWAECRRRAATRATCAAATR